MPSARAKSFAVPAGITASGDPAAAAMRRDRAERPVAARDAESIGALGRGGRGRRADGARRRRGRGGRRPSRPRRPAAPRCACRRCRCRRRRSRRGRRAWLRHAHNVRRPCATSFPTPPSSAPRSPARAARCARCCAAARAAAPIARLDLRLYRRRPLGGARARARAGRARSRRLGEHAALWLALGAGGWLVDAPRRGRWRRGAAASCSSTYVLNTAIKGVFRRTAPGARRPARARSRPRRRSASRRAHASSSFAAARGVLGAAARPRRCTRPPRRWRCRGVYLGVHYPTDIAAGARPRHGLRERRAMKVGIVGMPNAGKSSLFNALTRAGAEAANYPFTTIEPNVAVVPVARRAPRAGRRDRRRVEARPRHDRLPRHRRPRRAARHEGEGLGNKFLANIRETDAIVHVVRAHRDDERHPPRGPRRPAARHRDDRDRAGLRRPRAGRAPPRARRRATPAAATSAAVAEEALAARRHRPRCRPGSPARTVPRPGRRAGRAAQPRPADGQAGAVRGQRRRGRRRGARRRSPRTPRPHGARRRGRVLAPRGRAVRARRRGRRRDARRPRRLRVRPAARRRAARSTLLDLIAFFTAGEDKPAQSWHLRRGADAPGTPPAQIHSDIQHGFVRAEVIGWDALVDAGGYAGARDRGTLRLEGRDYVDARRRRHHRAVHAVGTSSTASSSIWAPLVSNSAACSARRGSAR